MNRSKSDESESAASDEDERWIDSAEEGSGGEIFRDFVVPESASGQRIDLFLTAACDGYSRTQIRQAVQDDQADVDGRTVRPSFKIRAGQAIRFKLPPEFSDDVRS